ncbi:hypothetical protein KP509_1Z233300 [Ceratopteris richardii]|nr:hypothetical protein KP509_1Z233300 [Ceratopteris richardii]
MENGSLPNLEELHITGCSKLKRLTLEATLLQRLELDECDGLEELDCKGLSSLRMLDLCCCESLRTLCSLPTTLQKLKLRDCKELEFLDIGGCSCLRDLDIMGCNPLVQSTISGWHRLTSDPSLQIRQLE